MMRYLRTHALPLLFFTMLTAGLCVGDGQQMPIDLIASGGTLLLFGVAVLFWKRERQFPPSLAVLWLVTLGYLGFQVWNSDDMGHTISDSVRFLNMFLVFYVFYSYATDVIRDSVVRYILMFSLLALGISVFYLGIPALRGTLPPTNLLVPSYGHNMIAAILLFGLPAAAQMFLEKKKLRYGIPLLVLLLGILASFARVGIMLTAMFLGVFLFIHRNGLGRIKRFLLAIPLLILTVFFALTMLVPSQSYMAFFPDSVLPKKMKLVTGGNQRLEYARQSIRAFRERPWFGSGPGTFFLQSRRLESGPDRASRYAHNVILQSAVEVGLAGILLMAAATSWFIIRLISMFKGSKPIHAPTVTCLWILGLQGLYAMFNFSYAMVIIQLLAAYVAATLCLRQDSKPATGRLSIAIIIGATAGLIGIYYFGATGCTIFPQGGDGRSCFVSEHLTLTTLSNPTAEISSGDIRLIERLHRNNPDVLFALSRYPGLLSSSERMDLVARAIRLNLYFMPPYTSLVTQYLERGEYLGAARLMSRELTGWHWSDLSDSGKIEPMLARAFARLTPGAYLDFLGSVADARLYVSKVYYLAGLQLLGSDTEAVRTLWSVARKLSPEWSYYHLESASLFVHEYDNYLAGKYILNVCRFQHPAAAAQCAGELVRLSKTPPPGSWKTFIRDIGH